MSSKKFDVLTHAHNAIGVEKQLKRDALNRQAKDREATLVKENAHGYPTPKKSHEEIARKTQAEQTFSPNAKAAVHPPHAEAADTSGKPMQVERRFELAGVQPTQQRQPGRGGVQFTPGGTNFTNATVQRQVTKATELAETTNRQSRYAARGATEQRGSGETTDRKMRQAGREGAQEMTDAKQERRFRITLSLGRSRQLAAHLLRTDQNESVRLYECRGTIAQDVEGALLELEARASGAQCRRPLYHASISPEADSPLSDEQVRIALDTLEAKLGLVAQPRVVVLHRKMGREHVHVVWSRIDIEHGRAIPGSWNYLRHEEAARELESRFGHRPLQSAVGRSRFGQGKPRPAHDYEYRQQERSGLAVEQVTAEITALWNSSLDGHSFHARLEEAGYVLARGDRRVFVIIDRAGEVHSLARRIRGATAHQVRDRLREVDLQSLPSVAGARSAKKGLGDASYPASSFIPAALEVTRPSMQSVSTRASLSARIAVDARANVFEMVCAVSQVSASRIPLRISSRFKAAAVPRPYRGMRAMLIADYAAKIAAARRNAPRHELDAILSALHAERQAALGALLRQQGGKARARRNAGQPGNRWHSGPYFIAGGMARLRKHRVRTIKRSPNSE